MRGTFPHPVSSRTAPLDRSDHARPAATRMLASDGMSPRGMSPRPVVRCLGWQALPLPHDTLIAAVSATLRSLGAPFEQTEGHEFVVHPVQPLVQSMVPLPEHTEPALIPASPLRVVIHVLPAEADNAGKSNVNIRRTTGGTWRFQDFYKVFRSAFTKQLGLGDERVLSMHSPMQFKRELENGGAALRAAGWARDPTTCERTQEASSFKRSKRPCWDANQIAPRHAVTTAPNVYRAG